MAKATAHEVPPARKSDVLAGVKHHLSTELQALHVRLGIVQALVRCVPTGNLGYVRAALYRLAGFRDIGRRVYIRGTLTLRGGGDIYSRLHIGAYTTINTPCFVDLSEHVWIGRRVGVGHHAILVTTNHELGPAWERRGRVKAMPVRIGDGAWIGARATIAPGVTAGPGAFISLGSVVTRDVPANAKVAGNPAIVVDWLGE